MTTRIRGRRRQERNHRILKTCPVCHICGHDIDLTIPYLDPVTNKVNPWAGTVDHVTALNNGGTEHHTNHAPAHARCNRAKSDKDHAPIVRRSGSLA
jgi:5-methylcytosine-specific restriction endonuclease McrA